MDLLLPEGYRKYCEYHAECVTELYAINERLSNIPLKGALIGGSVSGELSKALSAAQEAFKSLLENCEQTQETLVARLAQMNNFEDAYYKFIEERRAEIAATFGSDGSDSASDPDPDDLYSGYDEYEDPSYFEDDDYESYEDYGGGSPGEKAIEPSPPLFVYYIPWIEHAWRTGGMPSRITPDFYGEY